MRYFLLLMFLCSCNETAACKDAVYDKERYQHVQCNHSQHKLIDEDKYWKCICQVPDVVPSVSASAVFIPVPTVAQPAPTVEPKKIDTSWLDTDY